jgi:hypothetical protein
MAYTATVTTANKTVSGRRYFIIEVTETECAPASEFTVDGLPSGPLTLVLYRATLTAGTGTTIGPVGGNAASFSANTQGQEFSISAAAHVSESTHVPLFLRGNKLVVRSTPNNAAADHAITTYITIAEGTP